jgi:subfamily B ATP-binding cassette protein MsbA
VIQLALDFSIEPDRFWKGASFLKRILQYLLPYKRRIFFIIIVSIITSMLSLSNTWLLGRLTDAIFYRTKGLPLTLSWQKTQTQLNKDFVLNLTAKRPFSRETLGKIRSDIRKNGLTVQSVTPHNGLAIVKVEAPSGLANQPLKLATDLEARLTPLYGPLKVYIASGPEKTTRQPLLFPRYYTVFILPVLLVVIYLLLGVFRYAKSFAIEAMGQKIVMGLRNEIYQNLQNLSLSYFEKNKTGQAGQLISRILGDIGSIQFLFTSGIFDTVLEPIVVVIGLIWGFTLNWKLTLMFFFFVPILVWPINYLSKKLRKVNLEIMNRQADITGVLEESLSAVKVIKAFGTEDYEIKRFQRETRQSYEAAMRGTRVSQIFLPVIEFIVSIGLAAFLMYGGAQVINQSLSPGEFFAFVMLMSTIADPIRKLSGVFGNIPRSLVAAERVFELIDEQSEVVEAEHPVELSDIKGRVALTDVTFGYEPDNPVLHGIDLVVNPGEVIALVGPSGAGKTTIVNLIARFYDPVSGVITIDGHNLREIKLSSLRKQMGIVPQETILFRGTIAENIAYGKLDAPEAEIIAAAKAANAHEFISAMPDGYQTKVGTRGYTLSGGQRQRIAIARAILRDPRILILDEATSALDTQSEVLVQEALQRLMRDRTSFVIAHRLSTIRSASRIVVMNGGVISEIGSHGELIKKNGLYALLYRTQLHKEENATAQDSAVLNE